MADFSKKLLQLFNLQPEEGITRRIASLASANPGSAARLFDTISYGYTPFQDRLVKIRDLDTMDNYPDLHLALDLYADEVTQTSLEEKRKVWVRADKDVREELEDLFDRIDLENKIWAWARHLAKYGDMFVHLLISKDDGVSGIQYIHPSTMEVIKDAGNQYKVIGYKCTALERLFVDPQMVTEPIYDAEGRMFFDLWEFVHMKLPSDSLSSPYGESFLEAARQTWKQLEMLETAISIYRLHRAGTRLIYYVDVGTAAGDEARQIVEAFRRGMKNREYLKVGEIGEQLSYTDYLSKYNPFNLIEDIFWPKSQDNTSTVTPINADVDVRAIADVEHFKSKLRASLGIPKAYFDGEISGWNANKALALQDVQLAKKVGRLQTSLILGIEDMCRIHLTLRGYDGENVEFDIEMDAISQIFEMQKLETMSQKMSIANGMMGMVQNFGLDPNLMSAWVLKNVLGWDSYMVKKMKLATPTPEPSSTDLPDSSTIGPGEKNDPTGAPGADIQDTAGDVTEGVIPRRRKRLSNTQLELVRSAESLRYKLDNLRRVDILQEDMLEYPE